MTDERLERIESILQATVVLTQQNREDIAQLTREVRTIAGSLERTNERLNQFITQAESDRQFFRNEVTVIVKFCKKYTQITANNCYCG